VWLKSIYCLFAIIFICQLILKRRLATLPNKNALYSKAEGNKLICGVNGNLLEHLEGILDVIKEIISNHN